MINTTDYIYVAPGFNRKQIVLATKKYLYVFDTQHSTVDTETTFFIEGKKIHDYFTDRLADKNATLESLHNELMNFRDSKSDGVSNVRIVEIAKLKHFDVKASLFSSAIFGDDKFGMGYLPLVISVGKQKHEMKAFYLDQLKK